MNRNWWYVLAVIVVVVVVGFVFRDDVDFSPGKEGSSKTQEINLKTSLLDAIKEYQNDEQVREESNARIIDLLSNKDASNENLVRIMKRYLDNPEEFPENSPIKPIKIMDLSQYNLAVTHEDNFNQEDDGQSELTFQLLNIETKEYFDLEFINPNNYIINPSAIFNSDVYRVENMMFVDVKEFEEAVSSGKEEIRESPLTGYQVYTPPIPYNQVNRNFAVIIPYNSNYPLPANAVNYLQNKLNNNVVPFFQANSEGTATYTFTIFPVQVTSYNYVPFGLYINDIQSVLLDADPIIDYSQFDMAVFFVPNSMTNCCSGWANILYDSSGSVTNFPTNEPLMGAVPTIYFDPNDPDPNKAVEQVAEHEMGHLLVLFNPLYNNNYFFILPHSRGYSDSANYLSACQTLGPIIDCWPNPYGDFFSVMGIGKGLFSHHRAVHDLGFRSSNSVQTVTGSGTYTLCSTNHLSPGNCPQELLIQNPNGANLAIELIGTPLGPEYSFYQNCGNLFDSLVLRVTDIEQGGGLGNILYFGQSNLALFGGGDVIYPASSSSSGCTLPPSNGNPLQNVIDFPLHQGQSVTTPIGTITFQSLTSTSTGKQATVNLVYTTPTCATGPPTINIPSPGGSIMSFYENNLYQNFQEQVSILSKSTCIPTDNVNINTQVIAQGTTHVDSRIMSLPQGQQINLNFPIPQTLSTVAPGTYPYTITVTPASAPSQSSSWSGNLIILPSVPKITVAQTSLCSDTDPIPFNYQNLGANYQYQPSNPNSGATVSTVTPIPGFPNPFFVPDSCTFFGASDIVCSNNVPGIPNNLGGLIEWDCRFVLNNPSAICIQGNCY